MQETRVPYTALRGVNMALIIVLFLYRQCPRKAGIFYFHFADSLAKDPCPRSQKESLAKVGMTFGPPEFQFPSSSTPFLSQSPLMLNRIYTPTASGTQARTQRETRDRWVGGGVGFTSWCASRAAGREAGALGAEFTRADWGPGAERETPEDTPIQETSHWTTLLESHLQTIYWRQEGAVLPLQCSFCDKQVSEAMNRIHSPDMESCK